MLLLAKLKNSSVVSKEITKTLKLRNVLFGGKTQRKGMQQNDAQTKLSVVIK